MDNARVDVNAYDRCQIGVIIIINLTRTCASYIFITCCNGICTTLESSITCPITEVVCTNMHCTQSSGAFVSRVVVHRAVVSATTVKYLEKR